MRKNLFISLPLMVIVLLTINVQASSLTKDEIPNDSYIIGDNLFTREKNDEYNYNGELTTPLMLMAAKSIDGDLDDMIVYYKTFLGEWINGINGEAITPPDYFDIIMTNMEEENISKMLGDVYQDGTISIKDVVALLQYVTGKRKITTQSKKNGDVNQDGKIDGVDVVILLRRLVGKYDSLPITDYKIIGDINEDGNVDFADGIGSFNPINEIDFLDTSTFGGVSSEEVSFASTFVYGKYGELSAQAKKNADIDLDGYITYNDCKILLSYFRKGVNSINIEDEDAIALQVTRVMRGDFNLDNVIDNNDVNYLQYLVNYISEHGTSLIAPYVLQSMDVNKDNQVNAEDITALEELVQNNITTNEYIDL